MAKDIFMQAQLTNIPIIHVNLIKRFPTEIVSLIVKLLSPADVMNAREVCPEWQKKIDASITNTNIVKDFTFSHRINEAYIKNPSKAYLESQSFKIECLTQNYYYLHEASSNRHDVRGQPKISPVSILSIYSTLSMTLTTLTFEIFPTHGTKSSNGSR